MPKAPFIALLALLTACTVMQANDRSGGFQAQGQAVGKAAVVPEMTCPDGEFSRLINKGFYADARTLLQRRLSASSSRARRYCDLLSMSLQYALPASDRHDLQMARQFYADALRLGRKGEIPENVRLIALSLQQLLSIQGEVYSLQQHNIELRSTLSKKEEAIQKLKDVTLGNPH